MSKDINDIISIYESILDNKKIIYTYNKSKDLFNEAMLEPPLDKMPTKIKHGFGEKRTYEIHPGVDLSTPSGTAVKAPMDGVIDKIAYDSPKCGGTIIIDHGNGFRSGFCHIKRIDVKKGDVVKQGDVVGLSGGDTNDPGRGNSSGAHLHYTLRKDGQPVDPMKYINTNVADSSIDFQSDFDSNSNSDSTFDDIFQTGTTKSAELHRSDPILGSLGSEAGKEVLKSMIQGLAKESYNIQEQIKSTQIGKDCTESYGEYYCLAKLNKKIYSPVDGMVVTFTNNPTCKNPLTIAFETDKTKNYIQYCGIDKLRVTVGDTISKGDHIGSTESDFKVTTYDSSKSKKKLKITQLTKGPTTNPVHREDPLLGLLGSTLVAPLNIFKDKYDKDGNRIEKRWASPTDPEPADHTWSKKWSPTYPKKSKTEKVEEDIKRLKRLIK